MILFIFILALGIFSLLYLQHPKFGATPKGKRKERVLASPNYGKRSFLNRSYTPPLTEGHSMIRVMFQFFFAKPSGTIPSGKIPSVQTDLKQLPAGNWLVWFGHSSYFMQLDDRRYLVDPVFSGNASPLPFTTRAFKGANEYSVEDMPPIDYLFITHDHYDHLDHKTVVGLREKVGRVVCGLGVGAHLERWGYTPATIMEMDWDGIIQPEHGIRIHGLTARHFSGRTFKRDGTLWMSFLLEAANKKIYIGGDSGYDRHFKEIGKLHGPIDLAILENGQYNEAWRAIHFLPGENLQAAIDLKAVRLMPVHSGKFDLALHNWDEPLNELSRLNQGIGLPLVTPRIGELVNLDDNTQVFEEWWKTVDVAQPV